jgi:UPF0716 family protein affecting phage T7 exclusion
MVIAIAIFKDINNFGFTVTIIIIIITAVRGILLHHVPPCNNSRRRSAGTGGTGRTSRKQNHAVIIGRQSRSNTGRHWLRW